MIDMMMLIESGQPDPNGNVIPMTVQSGSVVFSNAKGKTVPMTLNLAVGAFDVTTATCCSQFVNCCGDSNFIVSPSAYLCPVGQSMQCTASATNCDGTTVYPSPSSWSCSNTAIATISSSGMMTGVAPGQVTITVNFSSAPLETGTFCVPHTCISHATSGSSPENVTSLTCGTSAGTQAQVTRGSTAVCSANQLPTGTTLSNWKFTDGTNTVTTSSTSSSWSGIAVQPGTASVTATQSGTQTSLSGQLQIKARTGWAFTAIQPAKVSNGGGTGACASALPVLSTPTSINSYFGYACLYQAWSTQLLQVSAGPNNGYWYVTSASNANGNVSTIFQWERVPDLDQTSSTFYQRQTGTYNASTDASGCISGSNLAAQTQRHENGSVEGHWGNYNNAQNSSSNNLGDIAELQVGAPSLSLSEFQNNTNSALNSAAQAILNAESVEPYPVNYDQNDVFLGYINFPSSYTSCK